eukprot:1156081-Pelagomonas_calceolata.AAC.11
MHSNGLDCRLEVPADAKFLHSCLEALSCAWTGKAWMVVRGHADVVQMVVQMVDMRSMDRGAWTGRAWMVLHGQVEHA